MRVLATTLDKFMPPGQMGVRVALAPGESAEQLAAEDTEIPGLGTAHIVRVRYTDSPEPGLLPGERVYSLDVDHIR